MCVSTAQEIWLKRVGGQTAHTRIRIQVQRTVNILVARNLIRDLDYSYTGTNPADE